MIKEQLKAASYSILGDRPTQQDAAGMEWADESLFVAVCDGMGGMQGGEFASTTGITTIADAFRSQRPSEENKTPEWLHSSLMRQIVRSPGFWIHQESRWEQALLLSLLYSGTTACTGDLSVTVSSII